MAYQPLTGWVSIRDVVGAGHAEVEARFHSDASCPHFGDHEGAEGPMLFGHAQRYRGLLACSCVPGGAAHVTRWKSQGYTYLHG